MSLPDQNSTVSGSKGNFDNTHWSMVLLAGRTSSPAVDAALSELCQIYWYPLYVFARRQGQTPENAQDLVQGFFARLLEKRYLQDANREKGKFRSFLLMALKRYMADEWDKANRIKRGGGQAILSLDAENTEMRFCAEPVDNLSPERAFDRRWARTLLEQVFKGLQTEFAAAGKAELFEALRPCVSGEKATGSYAEIGQKLGISESNVKVNVHRLRQRYRESLRAEIAKTVEGPDGVDEEIRQLFAALA